MDSVCPPDILNLLDASGLSNRKAAFQKNVPTAFASGVVTAEIIHAAYPKLIQLHSFADASNAQGRISNWELLNKKLKLFNCNLGEKDLTAIANRSYGTDDVCNFLRKLQIRMPSYEPVYLTQQMERNTTQKHQTSMQTTGARENTEGNKSPSKATMSKGTAQAVKKRFGTSTAGTSTSGLNINKSAGPAQNLSKAKTNKIMDSIWERQERVKKVAELTDDDIDRMYHEFAVMYKEETDNNNARAEKMNVRSRQIDAHFAALREANLADMDRTARRLTMLQTKPQMMDSMLGFEMDPLDFGEGEREAADIEHASSGYSEDGSSQAPSESVKNAGDNSNKIKKLYSSQRASTIENKLMAFIPDSPAAVVDGKPPIAVGDLDSDLRFVHLETVWNCVLFTCDLICGCVVNM